MSSYLDGIEKSSDVKKLNTEQLCELCKEIRDFLIDNVSKTGGHIASNLGVVELTVALHYVFDFPSDKIVFDVGHQSYVHKILTGRKEMFGSLRKFGGLSGFPKRVENECDSFNTGHSSTSISAALGIARGRDLAEDDYNVMALFGDGALTGGMMYEAMNDAGRTKIPLILILNDNAMSISKNVGAVSKHLRKLRISPFYFKSKHAVEGFLKKVPIGGEAVSKFIKNTKKKIKKFIVPTTLFDDLGFNYVGPVDGHDLISLISVFEYARDEKKPVFIHAMTVKGKGYSPAENNPQKFHGVGPFDKNTGATVGKEEDYSTHFGKTLTALAENNKKIVAITGAMPNGTGIECFAEKYRNRFFDVGIAEQHGVTFAAGLASTGFIPVIPLYSSFLQRAYDQTLHDVCLQNLHVIFPVDRAGIVGADGETHQGVYDISYLSHMPNMTILSPANYHQLDEMLEYAINRHKGPIAIRYPRGSEQASVPNKFEFGEMQHLQSGHDVSIIASGRMVNRAFEVSDILQNKGISCEIKAVPTIKPIDEASLIATAEKTNNVITIEDNVKIGGMGSMIASILEEKGINCRMRIFAFPDWPVPHGSIEELDHLCGMDAENIAESAKRMIWER